MSADRAAQRLDWTRTALDEPALVLEPASSDASFRSYWRTVGTSPSWIVMDAPPALEDVRPWVDVAQRLRAAGLNAPQVRAVDIERGFLAISDLGRNLMLPALDPDTVEDHYGSAIEVLLRMAGQVETDGLPSYDEVRLVTEMELMPTWFLQRHLGFVPECTEWDLIEVAFRSLVRNATQQPQVFVHRDFHSRNLLLPTGDAADLGIIDFQDAVRGPLTYDLVSLLRDCYVVWPEARVRDWAERFRRRAVDAGLTDAQPERFLRWFDRMGLQRHLKVLGIFCRLWYRDGKAGYLGDLPRVWHYVRTIGARDPECAPLVELLERAIGSRDLTRPAA